jgi:hypothetical protein
MRSAKSESQCAWLDPIWRIEFRRPGGANGSRECAPDDRLRATRESLGREEPRIALRFIRTTVRRRTARTLKSFSHHDNLFAETGRKTSRSSANDDEINPVNRPGVVVFSTGG